MTNKSKIIYRSFSYGEIHLTLAAFEGKLCLCDWQDSVKYDSGIRKITRTLRAKMAPEDPENPYPVLSLAETELSQYLRGERRRFSVPLLITGSDFHLKAMNHLLTIPYGETATYKDLADKLTDGGRMSQCIGSCVGSNLLSIFIPCHRVISRQFSNGGYRGGLTMKKLLLELENRNK